MENSTRIAKLKPVSRKILLLLFTGLALGLSHSPKQYFRIIRAAKSDWDRINKESLHRTIKTLYNSKLIDSKDNPDGSTTISLTKLGRAKALTYQIDEMKIPE